MRSVRTLLAAAALAAALPVSASSVFINFEGISPDGDTVAIGDFYRSLGVSFNSGALAIVDADAGGFGDFANAPSPSTVMGLTDLSAVLNVASGFDTSFRFNYSTTTFTARVNIWSGLNATGNLLGSVDLGSLGTVCPGTSDTFCNWGLSTVNFGGVGRSVEFQSSQRLQVLFDDLYFSSVVNTVPEPSTLSLMLLGLVGAGAASRRKKR